jgi:hypothetical protein
VFVHNKSNRMDDKSCCFEFFVSYPCLLLFHFIACVNCCHLCDLKTTLVPFAIVFVLVTLCSFIVLFFRCSIHNTREWFGLIFVVKCHIIYIDLKTHSELHECTCVVNVSSKLSIGIKVWDITLGGRGRFSRRLGGICCLRNDGNHPSHPRRPESSATPLRESQISH